MAKHETKDLSGRLELTGGITNLSTRSNIAGWHVIAAARATNSARILEEKHRGEEFGDFFHEIASDVMTSVFFSAAAIEAVVNEFFKDAHITISEHPMTLVHELWNSYEQKTRVLEKYDLALLLKGRPKLDRGAKVVQDAGGLISLRNAMVHFKPESSDEKGAHGRLGTRLKGKFGLSPFIGPGNSLFPKRCMSHSCARWALDSALGLIMFFGEAANLQSRFERLPLLAERYGAR